MNANTKNDGRLSSLFGAIYISAGLLVVLYQVVYWLYSGVFDSMTIVSVMERLLSHESSTWKWATYGGSWEGLRTLLGHIPVSMLLVVTGIAITNSD